jgi:hypothetical protein
VHRQLCLLGQIIKICNHGPTIEFFFRVLPSLPGTVPSPSHAFCFVNLLRRRISHTNERLATRVDGFYLTHSNARSDFVEIANGDEHGVHFALIEVQLEVMVAIVVFLPLALLVIGLILIILLRSGR